MIEFYDNYCTKQCGEDELYFFKGFQGKVELNKLNISFQRESENLLVRYANPKSNFDRLRFKEFEYDEKVCADETLSFTSALSDIEDGSENLVQDLSKNREVYFLPTDLERIIRDIILNNKRRRIPKILEPLIPADIKEKIDFDFVDIPDEVYICHNKIGEVSTSFLKLADATNISEVKRNMDYIKDNFNDSFIDGIDSYYIGDIKKGFGIMERDSKKKYEAPSTFHYNFVLRNNDEDKLEGLLKSLSGAFTPYPFK